MTLAHQKSTFESDQFKCLVADTNPLRSLYKLLYLIEPEDYCLKQIKTLLYQPITTCCPRCSLPQAKLNKHRCILDNGKHYEFIKLWFGPKTKRSFLCLEGCQIIFSSVQDLARHLYDCHTELNLQKWCINKNALHKQLHGSENSGSLSNPIIKVNNLNQTKYVLPAQVSKLLKI